MTGHDNLILTGFMGTGKTTVGRLLADRLGLDFVDTDELIVGRDGRSIDDIFRRDGEGRFRQWEREIAVELAARRGLVIATGGRLMLDCDNAALLGRTGPVFCLTAAPQTILNRLEADAVRRPLLDGPDAAQRVDELLRRRAAYYARYRAVSTDDRTPQAVAAEIVGMLEDGLIDRITVNYPGGSYDVVVGEDLLPRATAMAGIKGATAVITDDNVGPLYAARLGAPAAVITTPAGEAHKRLDTVRLVYDQLLAAGIDRQGGIISLGGGVVGDMAGFAAATYMRGIELALCPTTLLSMVDASIGGKTGVDLPQGKNLVGAFKQPRLVAADVGVLGSLPAAEFAAGMAETAKHGLIADPILWRRLTLEEWNAPPPVYFDDRLRRADLQSLVVQAIRVKRDVVEADPFETGRRAVLNLGHTFGHAVEQVSGYTIRHGEAVAMGLVAATHLSAALGYCRSNLAQEVEDVLARLNLPTRIPAALSPEAIYAAMGSDKKKQAGRLRFILIRDVGDVFIEENAPRAAVLDTVQALSGPEEAGEGVGET